MRQLPPRGSQEESHRDLHRRLEGDDEVSGQKLARRDACRSGQLAPRWYRFANQSVQLGYSLNPSTSQATTACTAKSLSVRRATFLASCGCSRQVPCAPKTK